MRVTKHCLDCLKGLAEKTVRLSGGSDILLIQCNNMIEQHHKKGYTPPYIANNILKHIKNITGSYNPYAKAKIKEFEDAKIAATSIKSYFPKTLEGVLKISAIGNSTDFFTENCFADKAEGLKFHIDMDKIQKEIYIKNNKVLLLGDNLGDFLFDMPLVGLLQDIGKEVHYAVKQHPIQNDLSMEDVRMLDLKNIYPNIISTETDEVGIKPEDMKGIIKDMWDNDATVIAKGMGNYETLSEYEGIRPVIHIMRIKCPAVSHFIQVEMGVHIAIVR